MTEAFSNLLAGVIWMRIKSAGSEICRLLRLKKGDGAIGDRLGERPCLELFP